jgi:hypothetical protein
VSPKRAVCELTILKWAAAQGPLALWRLTKSTENTLVSGEVKPEDSRHVPKLLPAANELGVRGVLSGSGSGTFLLPLHLGSQGSG